MKEMQLTLELDVRTAEQQKKIDNYLVARKNEVERQIVSMTNQYNTLAEMLNQTLYVNQYEETEQHLLNFMTLHELVLMCLHLENL